MIKRVKLVLRNFWYQDDSREIDDYQGEYVFCVYGLLRYVEVPTRDGAEIILCISNVKVDDPDVYELERLNSFRHSWRISDIEQDPDRRLVHTSPWIVSADEFLNKIAGRKKKLWAWFEV